MPLVLHQRSKKYFLIKNIKIMPFLKKFNKKPKKIKKINKPILIRIND